MKGSEILGSLMTSAMAATKDAAAAVGISVFRGSSRLMWRNNADFWLQFAK